MASSTRDKIWMELAEELVSRDDVRDGVRTELTAAMANPEQGAERVRSVLAQAVLQTSAPATGGTSPLPSDRAAASQAISLVDYALGRAADPKRLLTQRVSELLRVNLVQYAEAYSRAGGPSDMEAPDHLAARVVETLSKRSLVSETPRVGILTPDEVAEIQAGRLDPSKAPTVPTSGDAGRDLSRWMRERADQERRERLEAKRFEDGDYLFTVISPTASGCQVSVHPIVANGEVTEAPATSFAVEQPVEAPLISIWLKAPEPAREEISSFGLELSEQPDLTTLATMRDTAISLNQARISAYTRLLSLRPDLTGADRSRAERRLAEMEAESQLLSSALDAPAIRGFINRWQSELQRDMARLSDLPSISLAGRLNGLARLGGLSHRLSKLQALGSSLGESTRTYKMGGPRVLATAAAAGSVFDGPQTSVGASAQRAQAMVVAGEGLASDVVLRDAARSARPSSQRVRGIRALAQAGQKIRQALSNHALLDSTGLGTGSNLQPLLRANMPSDIRPRMSSPLLRNLLLPAIEIVSKGKKALARVGGAARQARIPISAIEPEMLYGIVLGESGSELAERRPEVARNVLREMGGLAERLDSAGGIPDMRILSGAGKIARERVSELAVGQQEAPETTPQPGSGQVAAEVIGEAAGMPVAGTPAGVNLPGAVADVAAELQSEGASLSTEIRDRIAPFVDVSSSQQVFSGPIASAALGEMGALGATIGSDIYVHEDVMSAGGAQAAAVVGHEATHVASGGGSVESQEAEAYRVEAEILSSLNEDRILAEEQPPPAASGGSTEDPTAAASEEGNKDVLIKQLTEVVAELMAEDIARERMRSPRYWY